MHELDTLGKELRRELGHPPADWVEQQRRRLRTVHVKRAPGASKRRVVAVVGFAALLTAVVLWFVWNSPDDAAGISLMASTTALPYRAPDGSVIRLEAGSQGHIKQQAHSTLFELQRGRGHFEVAKHPDQDFTVVAGRYQVHVVGTRFNVEYPDPDHLGVSVEEGRVAVRVPLRSTPVLLEAGDRLDVDQNQLALRAGAGRRAHEPSRGVLSGTSSSARGEKVSADSAARPRDEAGSMPSPPSGSAVSAEPSAPRDWHALYELGRYGAALELAKQQGFEGLTQTLPAARLVQLADAARLGGDSQAALLALRALESRFPGSAVAADAGFLIGRLHAQRGESGSAIQRLTAYLQTGENARYSLEATGRLMELHAAAGNRQPARALAARYLKRAPNGPYRRLAQSVLEQK